MKNTVAELKIRVYEGEEDLLTFLQNEAEKYERAISYMIKLYIRDKMQAKIAKIKKTAAKPAPIATTTATTTADGADDDDEYDWDRIIDDYMAGKDAK